MKKKLVVYCAGISARKYKTFGIVTDFGKVITFKMWPPKVGIKPSFGLDFTIKDENN
jgi:hypothetical protein